MRDSASATPSLHPAYLINKLNNYVKELNIILPNGTNIGVGSDKGHRAQGRRTVCGMRGDEDEWEKGITGDEETAGQCIMYYRRCLNN